MQMKETPFDFSAVFWPLKAIRRAWFIWNLQLSDRLRETLVRAEPILASGSSFEETSRSILDLAMGLMQADAATLCLPDEYEHGLFIHATRGLWHEDKAGRTLQLDDSFSGKVFKSGEPLSIYDVQNEPVLVYREAVMAEGFHGYLGVPLRLGADTKGVLDVWLRYPHSFSKREISRLAAFAKHAAVAIDRAHLFAEQQRLVRESILLASVSNELVSFSDLDKALNSIVRQIVDFLDLDCAWLFLTDQEGRAVNMKAMSARHPEVEIRPGAVFQLDKLSIFQNVLRCGKPMTARSETDFIQVEQIAAQLGQPVENLLVAPVIHRGQVLGILSMSSGIYNEQRRFDISLVRLACAIAQQIALGLEKAQADSRLVEEFRRLDAILSSIGDGVIATDREQHVVLCNMAAIRILGHPLHEVAGHERGHALIRPQTRKNETQEIERFIAQALASPDGEATRSLEMSIPRAEGNPALVSVSTSPLVDEQRQIQGTVIAFRDITREREVEQLKQEFTSLISHELRAPLTNIKLAAQLNMRGQLSPEEQRDTLKIIEEQAERLRVFVENVLQVARVDSGQLKLDSHPLEVRAVIELAQSFCEGIENSHLTEIKCEKDLWVVGDETHLVTILKNLLDNAYKYSDPGSAILVEAAPRDEAEVVVQVINRGWQIPPEDMGHIFEKFYRHQSHVQDYPGHGLGLYLVKMLVEAHGGHVWVTNRGGDEVCFGFVLPRHLEED